MRAALLLVALFVALFTAWIEVGGRAIHQAWILHAAESAEVFGKAGRVSIGAISTAAEADRAAFLGVYVGGLGEVLASRDAASPRRP